MGQVESTISALFKVGEKDNIDGLAAETNFSQEEIEKLNEKFKKDFPKGYLTQDEFIEVYCEHAPKNKNKTSGSTRLVAKQLFQTLDKSGDGKIDFKEFICSLSMSTRGTVEEKLKWVFAVYDINNDGKLSLDEILCIVRSMQTLVPRKDRLSDAIVREIFLKCDKNNDGYLTVDEFVNIAKSSPKFLKLINDSMQTP